MGIVVKKGDALETVTDVLVVGVSEEISERAKTFDKIVSAIPGLDQLLEKNEFKGKKDQTFDFPTHGLLKAKIVFLVGLGKDKPTEASLRKFGAKAGRFAISAKANRLTVEVIDSMDNPEKAICEGICLGKYRYTKYLTGDRLPKYEIESVELFIQKEITPTLLRNVEMGEQVAKSIDLARDLINEPPNELYPEEMARIAVEVSKECGLGFEVFDPEELTKRGMNLLLAVGQGSDRGPRLIHLTYVPKGTPKKKLAFVGKGITFDTGGISIKPGAGMEEMKGDMGGAANVIALMKAVSILKPDVEVHGIIAAAENMPDGKAYRPADIFKSYNGKTVEIINTDAEGRLILADALAFAKELNPDMILDNATLTGACVVALGMTVSGYFSNKEDLAERFKQASKSSGESMWELPLVEELREGLKSDWADIKHMSDRWGGAITAALFLKEFVGDVPWLHVDIAGPSMQNKASGLHPKGGTGHGVLTFLKLIESFDKE